MTSYSRLKAPARRVTQLEQWPGRTSLASFVHCLHLLDLDLLDDWPHITAQTLSTRSPSQNLQLRIKAVEWSLFRLCELYDAQTARDKLRPFFPPQNQLQSQNLRAALLRVLTELKRLGVLEKDVVLRKTIFDECKGEKFEELLAGFASVVLEKQIVQRQTVLSSIRPSEDSALPLILSYRQSLRANLDNREALRKKLLDHEHDVTLRRDRVAQVEKDLRHHKGLPSGVGDHTQQSIRDTWAADPAWVDALMRGFPPGKDLLQVDDNCVPSHGPTKRLQELQNLTVSENARAQRWASFRSSLRLPKSEPTDRELSGPSTTIRLKFDKHQCLEAHELSGGLADEEHGISDTSRRHCDLLRRLRAELNPSHSYVSSLAAGQSASPSPVALRRFSPDERPPMQNEATLLSNSEHEARNLDQEAHSLDTRAAAKIALSTSTDTAEPAVADYSSPSAEDSSAESTWIPVAPALPTVCPSSEPESPTEEGGVPPSAFDSSPAVTPMPASRPSLQERTRMSLAGAFRDQANVPHTTSVLATKDSSGPQFARGNLSPAYADGVSDLAQRTRKSMSLLTTLSEMKTARRRSRDARASQLYPVNPFETPRKSSLQLDVPTPDSGGSTPREKLFSDEADMSSVFKSRPKIALSPMMSPDRSLLEQDSIVASRADTMSLDEESDTATPTRN